MTNQLTTKLRLVKCPTCRRVLAELPNIPVYKCGGCGTVLQAKKHRTDNKDTGLQNHETETAKKNELEHVSKDKEAQSSSPEETLLSTGELLLDKNSGGRQNDIKDSNGVQSRDINFSSKLSTELACHGKEESYLTARAEAAGEQDKCSLEQENEGDQNEYGHCTGKQPGDLNFSGEVASSTELDHHGSEESVDGAHSEVDKNGNCLEQNNGRDQNEYGSCNVKQPEGVKSSDIEAASSIVLNHNEFKESLLVAGAHSKADENRDCLEQRYGRNQNEYGYCNGKPPEDINFPDEAVSSPELNHHESDEASPVAGAHIEPDENRNCLEENGGSNQSEGCKWKCPRNMEFSNEVSSSTELKSPLVGRNTELDETLTSANLVDVSMRDSIITAQMPLNEIILVEQSQKRAPEDFHSVSPIDALDNTALVNNSSEFSAMLGDVPRSPTTRSNYAYDGSISSYDGTDDQVPDHDLLRLSKGKFKEVESGNSTIPTQDEVMKNFTMGAEMESEAWNCSPISSENKHYDKKGSKWYQDELLERRRDGHPVSSRMKIETGQRPSRVPFYSRGSQVGYKNGSPSNYGRNEFQCDTSFHSPIRPCYLEDEKMELLRMVHELQDQLNRAHISKGKANGRFPRAAEMEKHMPSCYDPAEPGLETSHDLSYTRYPRRWNQGKSCPHRSRISRIPFSAEATTGRHQIGHSCLHCCPQNWQCSSPLPPPTCCRKSRYTAHPCQRCYNLYHSSPSSPLHYTSSEFSMRSCEMKSEDHWHRSHEMKKYSRERHHLVKRHVRPVVSGAPFLVCYRCSEVLQLPADFLLFRRRCHQLRCSSCSVILKFSLQNGTHIVPYTDFAPDAIAPPPSEAEVDGCSDVNNGTKLASSVSYAGNFPHPDTISCSDGYGPSLGKSCSTEVEALSSALPLHAVKRDSNIRKLSSGSSCEPMGEVKKPPTFKVPRNKYKNPVESFASAGPSSQMSRAGTLSSEIEELPPAGSSPLHKLMGYSSPSKVIRS